MKLVMVFHSDKEEGLVDLPIELGANPPMSISGMHKILHLVPAIKAQGPYQAAYVSRMARAMDTASVLSLALDIDFTTIANLGQADNKNGSPVIMLPGHEMDGFKTWQDTGLAALQHIKFMHHEATVLVVSHRPIIGAIIAAKKDVSNEAGIKKIVMDQDLGKEGFVVLDF